MLLYLVGAPVVIRRVAREALARVVPGVAPGDRGPAGGRAEEQLLRVDPTARRDVDLRAVLASAAEPPGL